MLIKISKKYPVRKFSGKTTMKISRFILKIKKKLNSCLFQPQKCQEIKKSLLTRYLKTNIPSFQWFSKYCIIFNTRLVLMFYVRTFRAESYKFRVNRKNILEPAPPLFEPWIKNPPINYSLLISIWKSSQSSITF